MHEEMLESAHQLGMSEDTLVAEERKGEKQGVRGGEGKQCAL